MRLWNIVGAASTPADNSLSFHSINSATAAYRPTMDVLYAP